jgi:cysteinyl-tRNA synthetase
MRFDAMDLKLYDTLTREKRVFKPLDPANARMYVCGPTVYDFAHIGNARPVIVFDVLFRLLQYLGEKGVWDNGKGETKVTYVRNITDVDDKINARAAERNITIQKLTEETYQDFKNDVAALGCLNPTHEPRATKYIRSADSNIDMVRMIERLVRNQHAYVEQDHVLFNVPSMPDYGKLSRRSLDEMIAGARVEVAPYKRNPMDFVLWKPSDERQANYPLPKWQSPCDIATPGRPGWHIECSAMSAALLGETFDIHGGGIDLLFPHHENEIAQTRCAFHSKTMANYWMHNGFLQVEGEKMSKSLGNFVTIHELLTGWNGYRWPGAVLKFAMLSTHYRQPINWTQQKLEEAAVTLSTFRQRCFDDGGSEPANEVLDALKDDLNTPQAIAELHKLFDRSQKGQVSSSAVRSSCRFLGINVAEVDLADTILKQVDDAAVVALIEKRSIARKAKDFKESDRIRDELAAMGVVLKDSKDGTTWEIAR